MGSKGRTSFFHLMNKSKINDHRAELAEISNVSLLISSSLTICRHQEPRLLRLLFYFFLYSCYILTLLPIISFHFLLCKTKSDDFIKKTKYIYHLAYISTIKYMFLKILKVHLLVLFWYICTKFVHLVQSAKWWQEYRKTSVFRCIRYILIT